MGIFPTDIPFDESGLNQDRWHFQLSEPFNGWNVGANLENGRTVEPVMTRVLRRIAGGMGSMLVGAMRVEGGPVIELGDCSTLKPAPSADELEAKRAQELAEAEAAHAVEVAAAKAAAAQAEAEEFAKLESERIAADEKAAAELLEAEAKAKADAEELSKLEAELKALETAETEAPGDPSTPAAVPALESLTPRDDGAAAPSSAKAGKDKGKK